MTSIPVQHTDDTACTDAAPAPIRHGEILLLPCAEPDPAEVQMLERTTEAIVGHSETGHHHVLECAVPVEVIHADGRFVRLREAGMLVRRKDTDRHRDLPVPAGLYRVLSKTSYHPFEQVLRTVVD